MNSNCNGGKVTIHGLGSLGSGLWALGVRMNPVQDQEEEEELRRNPLLKIVIAVWSYCVDR